MESPSERLDKAMDDRRLDLHLNWNDVATTAKVAPATLRAIRRGTSQPTPLTKRRLEDALQWVQGSIDAVMEGGEPSTYEAETDRQMAEREYGQQPFAAIAAELAAQLAEQQRRTSALEQRFAEYIAQQDEERKRRGQSG